MEHQRLDAKQRAYPKSVLLIPIAILLVLIFLKPVPLIGGYTDDFRYLTGAQCLDCLPTNHWERRFAIVWPTGIAIKLFGQNFWSVMIFPIAASITAVILTFKLVEHQYGRKAGLIAACVLVLTPVFADRSMRIAIDIIELVFLLGAVFLLQRRKGHFWAGILMALAVLCRPTMLAALPMVAVLAWWQDPKALKWFTLGFVLPLVGEALVYFAVAGDPLYPWKLSMQHMQAWRASMNEYWYADFMSPGVDTTKSPLFNPDFIGGWVPSARVEAHWTVQGLINLLVGTECGMTLCAGLLLSLLAWKKLDRLQLALIASAALFFGALTYAFAVDPRPRMFLSIVVVAAALTGSLLRNPWPPPRNWVVRTFYVLIVITAAIGVWKRPDYGPDVQRAEWLLGQRTYQVTGSAREKMALMRQDYPAGGIDLIEIDRYCPPLLEERWLRHRDRNLCIYSRRPGLNNAWLALQPRRMQADRDRELRTYLASQDR